MKTWFISVTLGILIGYLFGKASFPQNVPQKHERTITVKDSVVSIHRFPQWYTSSNIALWGPGAEKEREKYVSY